MRMLLILVWSAFLTAHAWAQQYGWVRVAQLGNQFTDLQAVDFVDSLHGWTAYGSDSIYRTTDGGNTWASSSGSPMGVNTISMIDTLQGWCVGNQGSRGKILHTTDGGLSWASRVEKENREYRGTAFLTRVANLTTGSTRNYVPDTGKVTETTNGGMTWSERTIADSIQVLHKVQFVDSLHGYINTFSTRGMFKTIDGGNTWSLLPSPSFRAFFFVDSLRGWGFDPFERTVYGTRNGGVRWDSLAKAGTADEEFQARAVSFVDTSTGWLFGGASFFGDYAAIFRTTDGGMTWVRDHQGGATDLLDGLMIDRYHGWAVGTAGSVFAYRQVTGVPEIVEGLPGGYVLRPCYPNPFNPTTTIEYEVLKRSSVQLRICDATGKEVRELVNAQHEPGVYRITFDATGLASGVYYCTMLTEWTQEVKEMLFLK